LKRALRTSLSLKNRRGKSRVQGAVID
jgi:hypothetical protein